jgi:hypothetical protein
MQKREKGYNHFLRKIKTVPDYNRITYPLRRWSPVKTGRDRRRNEVNPGSLFPSNFLNSTHLLNSLRYEFLFMSGM